MKVVSLLVFIIIICTIESALTEFSYKLCSNFNGTTLDTQGFSKDFCRSLDVTSSTNKCCYVKYKKDDKTYYNCVELTPKQFYNIKDTKSSLELDGTVKSIVCDSSSYLYISLFLLLIALL